MKTKNILVRKDLSCCIADLGLAVKEVRCRPKSRKDLLVANASNQEHVVIDIQANNRVGTQRKFNFEFRKKIQFSFKGYMSPEVLNGTLNDRSFESFKAADIYALGLVYWEILRRCNTSSTGENEYDETLLSLLFIENDADEYQVPYEDVLPTDPQPDQMRDVVCTRKIRPPTSPRWLNHPVGFLLMNNT